ncbi:FtsW/RodA/SpoVE family cell cycle protein [Oligosphaera ethanolica]|uniref:Probable peptidoglycan glycosyltransferase FtsW n=1 Tax=Oligosphaera ethanolica TaxID=760260 RepID=A0AAE3VGF6_9BACT|nr:FtsW/RodA/SpoVE family cell cycle protein [Oligosphaera ethanolica]MDQ0289920.1 cell division protein FtsW [Oligosphaera ethanolica]
MAVTSASTSMPPPTNNGTSGHNQRPVRPSGRSPGRWRSAWRLALLITLIGVAGCLIIGSVTRGSTSTLQFHLRQGVWLLCALTTLAMAFALPRQTLLRLAAVAGAAAYLALLGVLLFGVRINGMRGWYRFHSFCMQPSELAKPFFILGFAWLIARRAPATPSWRHFALALFYAMLWMLPVMLQPDWGTTLIYGLTALALIYACGIGWQHVAFLAGAGSAGLLAVCLRYNYVYERFLAFFGLGSPEIGARVGWQAMQMRNCFIKGGWTGTLFADNDAALLLVPFRYNDSLFACAAELLGVFGVLPLVILCFGWLAYCCYRAQRSRSVFAYAVYIGAGFMLSGQAFIHLAVNLGLMPTTGITLPLLSYGGSSLLASVIILTMVERLACEEV